MPDTVSTLSLRTMTVDEKERYLKELDARIRARHAELLDLAIQATRLTHFPGAAMALRGDADKIESYMRFTYWLRDNGYPWSDILWVALPVVTQLHKWDFFWLTRNSAERWYLQDAKKLSTWLEEQGLVYRKETEGKESYKLWATAKLLTILNGETQLQLV